MPIEKWVVLLAASILTTGVVLVASRRRDAWRLGLFSAFLIAVLLALRWRTTGHPPVFGSFEMDLAEATTLVFVAAFLERRTGFVPLRAVFVIAILALLHSLTVRCDPTPLTISEVSLWIDLHAVAAWFAWSFLLIAAAMAFGAEEHDPEALRLVGLGFVCQTIMGFTGVYYASILFARPWSWDPAQTAGLISWLLIGLTIHCRLFFGLTFRRQRWFLAFCVLVFALAGKVPMYLRAGQTFHVFEVGALAGEGR